MTVQRSHGTPRPQVAPLDELPEVQPGEPEPVERRSDGTVASSAAAKALGRRGGAAKAARARLVSALGLAEVAEDAEFAPYRAAGDDWVRVHLEDLSCQCGGSLGPGPSSIVASAGLQLAASRFLADLAVKKADPKLFHLSSTLANDSRQNLLAAFELGAREARARRDAFDHASRTSPKKHPGTSIWVDDEGADS